MVVLAMLPSFSLQAWAQESDQEFEQSVQRFGESMQDMFSRIWVPRARFRDGPHVRSAFQNVIQTARKATVEIRNGNRRVAYGGVVGPDGWVLTKGSLLATADNKLLCRLSDGREFAARVVGLDREYDLAMLKIDSEEDSFPFLELNGSSQEQSRGPSALKVSATRKPTPESNSEEPFTVHAGDWVATVGSGKNPVAIGIVSVVSREIQRQPGFLGVGVEKAEGGVLVTQIVPKSSAAKAGLRRDDLIREVNQSRVDSLEKLREIVQAVNPGEAVTLTITREVNSKPKEMTLQAIILGREYDSRSTYQNNLGSKLSNRRFGFPSALQHDTVLAPTDCGGPIVNLDGRVIGFNIARSGRTESYAIPVEAIHDRLFDLMSGRLAP